MTIFRARCPLNREAWVVKTTAAVAVLALALAGSAFAKPAPKTSWEKMTLQQRLHVVNHSIAVHRPPVQWWVRVRSKRFPASAAAPTHFCRAIGISTPSEICVHAQSLVKALNMHAKIDAHLSRIHAAKRAAALAASFPPHHRLWDCIGHYEGGPKSVNPNGHYGKLQMSWNWLGQIRGAASDYSEAQQEWAAERAYRASGYSASFLNGQWFNYDNADGCIVYA